MYCGHAVLVLFWHVRPIPFPRVLPCSLLITRLTPLFFRVCLFILKLVLLSVLVLFCTVHYTERYRLRYQLRVGEAKECQDLRQPGVPSEEAGRGAVQVPPVPGGDVLLPRAQRRALARAHESVQGGAAEVRPPRVRESSGDPVPPVRRGDVLQRGAQVRSLVGGAQEQVQGAVLFEIGSS